MASDWFKAAIDAALLARSEAGEVLPEEVARDLIAGLAAAEEEKLNALRDRVFLYFTETSVRRSMRRAISRTDPRQAWLALPEYEHIPQFIKLEDGLLVRVTDASLKQFRESETELRNRIKSYDYPRRSKEKLKRDKQVLREMRNADRNAAGYFVGDEAMKMGRAMELHKAHLSTEATKQRRAAAVHATRARLGRTKNQQLPGDEK
jgi:hypothetical protein